MFTPGDNDWTDCDRPVERRLQLARALELERQLFFGTPYSLGTTPISQEVQSGDEPKCLGGTNASPHPTDCVENRRWSVRASLYATVNVQGSCNNLCDTAPTRPRKRRATTADIQWVSRPSPRRRTTARPR
jgi:hypothetical protein